MIARGRLSCEGNISGDLQSVFFKSMSYCSEGIPIKEPVNAEEVKTVVAPNDSYVPYVMFGGLLGLGFGLALGLSLLKVSK